MDSNEKVYPFVSYVHFKDQKKIYSFGSEDDKFEVGQSVVVETVKGQEIGYIAKPSEVWMSEGVALKPVLRVATQEDLKRQEKNVEKAEKAMKICSEYIEELQLDMSLIEGEYTLDGSRLTLVYVAEERVDFRELLKKLASRLKCRIELRQIGPRNKAKIVGGLGDCGMETCCSRFMTEFEAVSINMAKNQMLALNIPKLSGQCGKLKCCLRFEDLQYKELKKDLPKLNSFVEFEGEKFRLTGMNLFLKQAKIENRGDVRFVQFEELWPEIDFSNR